jgi:glutathione S-transferase
MIMSNETDLLYFYSPGACSLSGQVVLEWLGEPYELCRVDPAVRAGEAFRRINPQGKVPALRTGGVFVAENSAILQHLAQRQADKDLMPPLGSPERDTLQQWLSYLGSSFHVAFYPYFMPSRYVKDEALFPAVKEAALEQIRKQFAFVDAHLQGREYMLGETRSVLDPYLYAMSRWGKRLMDVPSEFPNVARHQARMEAEPAVQFALSSEQGEATNSPSGAFRGQVSLDEAAAS